MDDHPPPSRTASAPIPELLPAARAFLDAFGGDVPDWLRVEADQLEAAIARERFPIDLAQQNDPKVAPEQRAAAAARAQTFLDRTAGHSLVRVNGETLTVYFHAGKAIAVTREDRTARMGCRQLALSSQRAQAAIALAAGGAS